VCAAVAAVAVLPGHEGEEHGESVQPRVQQIARGAGEVVIGIACLPANPFVGETVQCEFRAARGGPDGTSSYLTPAEVRLSRRGSTAAPVVLDAHKEQTAGVYGVHHALDSAGEYELSVAWTSTEGRVDGRQPLRVAGGPVQNVRLGLALLLGLVVLLVSAGQLRSRRGDDARAPLPRVLAIVAAGAVLIWLIDATVAPRLGAAFLPERPLAHVEWAAVSPTPAAGDAAAALATARGEPVVASASAPAPASDPGTLDVNGIVRPAPDRIAEVIVPMPARVVFPEGFQPAVGRHVKKGQPLVQLEQTYILHDAVHLIQERWPVIESWLAARRAVLQAEADVARVRYQRQFRGLPEILVKQAEATLQLARDEQTRINAVLRMHDAQISAKEPVKRPLNAPIDGMITEADFTQGQMVYEGHKLFTVVDLDTVWVELKVPEPRVPQARRAWRESVTLHAPAFPGATFTGRLVQTAPALDETTRTLSFFFRVANPKELLRIGMLVNAALGERDSET
jgi:multidrug efflux pump subunit AcrA (membrane-fusion protein)